MKSGWRNRGMLALALGLPIGVWAGAGDGKPVTWSPHGGQIGCRMNMGPTGAGAWMRGYQFQVMTVDAGSPGDGTLLPGDLVVGAGGTTFSPDADSRMTLGNAIGRAEATDGALALTIQRDGRKRRVTVRLPITGPSAATWPYGCAKSQRVLHDACEYLLEAQLPGGEVVTDGGIGTFLSGLLLLAAGEARFMDGARRAAYATVAMDLEKMDYHNWPQGYGGLLLAEYYLATGDAGVLAKLKEIVDHLARGQMRCGSWGHKGPSEGYGAMNQAGIVCAIAMSLAQECGLEVDRGALNRALAFYGRYAELGAVPYGDDAPGLQLPDDNGKSASTAVLCSLHPEWQGAASVFSRSVAMSYWLRETGHTGGFFSMVWGPLACAMAGEGEFQTFMDYQGWYYNLCRTWRGALVLLPYHEALTRFDDSTYAWDGGEFTAGGMALAFALPHHKLRILGAPRSVFGAEIGGPLLEARQAYLSRRWQAFDAAVAAARGAGGGPERQRWLAQLEAAAAMLRADAARTVKEIENNIAEGDAYRAEEQYRALKRFLGDQDERVLALDKRFADSTIQWHARTGRQYYEAWQKLRGVAVMSWLPYGEKAKAHVGEVPKLRPRLWETLAPVAGETPADWRKAGDGGAVSGRRAFNLATTDYAALRIQLQSPRNAHTRVELNGVQVAEVVRGQRSGYARIELDTNAVSLLRMGTNVLAVSSTSAGSGGNALDLGLDAVVRERPLAMTPSRGDAPLAPALPETLRAALERARATFHKMPLADRADPAVPERLRVRDSMDRFQAALDAACDAMSTDAVRDAVRSPVAYWRFLAGKSLARRGAAGLRIATDGLHDEDWRVRSACCDALTFIRTSATRTEDEEEDFAPAAGDKAAASDSARAARLTALLADENAWVRCRAATALGAMGKADSAVVTALVKAAVDPDAWVRSAALGAINKVTDDPQAVLRAAGEALRVPSTSFAQMGRAMGLIAKYGADDKALLPSLVFTLEHPGEGDGSQGLSQVMTMLVDLDPGGATAVPTLAKVAAGGYAYDRLRGAPRQAAIERLGKMGPKAAAAVPVLKSIAAGTDEKQKELRAAAQAALDRIIR